jgi:predicted anti-sigma-YlaC factor YlaD
VNCEANQEQVSLLIDAELAEADQVTVFRHLEGCPDCRLFFQSMIRLRKAAKRDLEEISLAANEILPQRLAPAPLGGETKRRANWLAGGWRMPAPAAVGLAVVLLVTGALVGSRLVGISGSAGRQGLAGRTVRPTVVVVCSLPEVQVLGSRSRL